jgi:hypothetical protein
MPAPPVCVAAFGPRSADRFALGFGPRALNFRPSPGFDFSLIDDDMKAISGLDRAEIGRTGPNPEEFDYIPYTSQCD